MGAIAVPALSGLLDAQTMLLVGGNGMREMGLYALAGREASSARALILCPHKGKE
jgi:predicted exporter